MRSPFTEDDVDRLVAAGRGNGEGAAYIPWVNVRDFSSLGVCFRPTGWRSGRVHEFFSTVEYHCFLILQWMDSVVDVREQLPLLPIEDTKRIAQCLGVEHPRHRFSRKPVVMTTDLVVTRVDGGQRLTEAISCKRSSDLQDTRTLEKQEIERLWWAEQNIRWSIVTERELNGNLVKNLVWVEDHWALGVPEEEDRIRIAASAYDGIHQTPSASLSRVCNALDDRLGHPPGTALAVARHAIARKWWKVPMNIAINAQMPLPGLTKGACWPLNRTSTPGRQVA